MRLMECIRLRVKDFDFDSSKEKSHRGSVQRIWCRLSTILVSREIPQRQSEMDLAVRFSLSFVIAGLTGWRYSSFSCE
jgi:integrase